MALALQDQEFVSVLFIGRAHYMGMLMLSLEDHHTVCIKCFHLIDGVVCHQYCPGPTNVTVPLIPSSLRQSILQQVHDAPGAGHPKS